MIWRFNAEIFSRKGNHAPSDAVIEQFTGLSTGEKRFWHMEKTSAIYVTQLI
jgi:hypothetical protein